MPTKIAAKIEEYIFKVIFAPLTGPNCYTYSQMPH